MSEGHYLISEASKKTKTEAHVLRYWEEELELKIPRNELGHRYYTEAHIELFQEIQELKNKGYQLRTIKNLLVGNELVGAEPEDIGAELYETESTAGSDHSTPALPEARNLPSARAETLPSLSPAEKMERFQDIMTEIMAQAMARNQMALSEEISSQVGDKLIKEINYLARERDEMDEERFRKLDEALRSTQKNNKGRAEAAATKAPVMKMKKKKRLGRSLT